MPAPPAAKLFNDPIHGFIEVRRGLALQLADHPYLQRLRRIQQLGLGSLVFPGATHARFSHALGAYHLVSQALRSLRESLAAARGEAAPAEAARGEPRRFGLGSLIDRMSGNPAAAAPAQPAAPRAEAPRTDAARPEAGRDADQDRVDIPAFLRRQAN